MPTIKVDTLSRQIILDGSPVHTTNREYTLLRFMATTPRKAYTRQELRSAANIAGADRTVDQYVSRIRKILGRHAIRTVAGYGYSAPDIILSLEPTS